MKLVKLIEIKQSKRERKLNNSDYSILKNIEFKVMGNQQSVKSEPKPIPNLSIGAPVPSSIRSSRSKPRVPKDPRLLGSNIFTEHNGESKIVQV